MLIIGIILNYFLGSIPTAYVFGKLLKGIDIREHGSGNVGATNVFRVLGKGPGFTVTDALAASSPTLVSDDAFTMSAKVPANVSAVNTPLSVIEPPSTSTDHVIVVGTTLPNSSRATAVNCVPS